MQETRCGRIVGEVLGAVCAVALGLQLLAWGLGGLLPRL